jgi:hypothetical protein
VRSLAFDRDGKLVGRAARRACIACATTDAACCAPGRAGDASGGDVHAIAAAPDRHLWLSVFGDGLRRFDPATGQSRRCASP